MSGVGRAPCPSGNVDGQGARPTNTARGLAAQGVDVEGILRVIVRVICSIGLLVVLETDRLLAQEAPANPVAVAGANPPAAAPQPSTLEIIFSGGPLGVAIMLVIIGMSLVAAYLVFEHALSLRRKMILPDGLGDEVRQLVLAGRTAEAEQACRARPSVLAFVLMHGAAEVDAGWTAVEKALEDAVAEQSARLFRKLEYLNVLANLAPMMGLLGTVVGMILCFHQVASTQGSAGAADLAEGIYQALVTTVAGLMIAIPALGAFAIFRNRIDQYIAEVSGIALHVFAPLKKGKTLPPGPAKRQTPPPPPPEGAR
jgi:biopolymer transport protein ExbB